MNSNRVLPKRVKKKKKSKMQTWEENVDPNIHLVSIWIRVHVFSFFFLFLFLFFFFHAFLEECGYCSCTVAWTVTANVYFFRKQCICARFMDPQISFFINFFIKNGSHDTIYTFKNYFATVISAINFQFQQNKSYPNRSLYCIVALAWLERLVNKQVRADAA